MSMGWRLSTQGAMFQGLDLGWRAVLPPGVRVLARVKRRRRRRPPAGRHSRAIDKAARLAAARRWIPSNPLWVHANRAEDAVRWGTR